MPIPNPQCDDLPTRPAASGRLFLWFPIGLAMRKVRRYLRDTDRVFGTSSTGALVIDGQAGYPDELIVDITDLLTPDEAADTRCLFKVGNEDLDVEDIPNVRTVAQLQRLRESGWLVDMLRTNRLTSVFQPIVHAQETSRVLGHEMFLRGIDRSGRTVSPGALFDAARGCGIVSELDSAARRTAIRSAASRSERRPLFVNVTPDAIGDASRAMESTITAVDAAGIPRERVVFEVIEAERAADVRQLRTVLDSFRTAGFRVALDNIGCADSSLSLIRHLRPDYVKVDMEQLRGGHAAASESRGAERIFDLANRLRIQTIAEAVETGEELEWNQERGATFVQGYYIARPSAEPVRGLAA
ncbi:MAG TPA: EAL domain-containing protein [Gemmatimonadaceae bacterium]|nr:EAL domain-containing protein [Gemmatimonadaceae bacterium]